MHILSHSMAATAALILCHATQLMPSWEDHQASMHMQIDDSGSTMTGGHFTAGALPV